MISISYNAIRKLNNPQRTFSFLWTSNPVKDPNPNTNNFYFDINLTGGEAEYNLSNFGLSGYGDIGDFPIIGNWDGDGDDNIGIYRPSTKQFFFKSNIPEIIETDTYTYIRSITCQSVEPDPYNPIGETSQFFNSDKYVYSWIHLENVYNILLIIWEWYKPNGNLFAGYGHFTDDPADSGYEYWGWYKDWSLIGIQNSTDYGQWHIDISIDGDRVSTLYFTLNPPPNDPPHTPTNIWPSNGFIDVITTPILTWQGGDPNPSNTVTYDVYFSTNSDPSTLVSSNQTQTTYNPGSLNHLTTYYWKIVARDNLGAETTGPVWHFTTVRAPITIYVPTDYPTIQEAIDVSIKEDTLQVSAGTYIENIDFKNRAITLKSESGPTETTIQGTGTSHVVIGATGSTIQGFTITGGWVGIIANLATMTIRGNIITGNLSGIDIHHYRKPLIENNLIYKNTYHGIVSSVYSAPTIINNTIAFNGNYGIISATSTGLVANNIIFSNGSNGIYCTMPDFLPEIRYNNVYGNQMGDYSGCVPGEEDISEDPLFINPDNNDFHLQPTSLCIDAGTNEDAPDTDFEGNLRPIDGDNDGQAITDMGAYEILPGDLDGDDDVDRDDLNIVLSHRNQPSSTCPVCDLDGDSMITVLDARKLVLLCTCPRCICP